MNEWQVQSPLDKFTIPLILQGRSSDTECLMKHNRNKKPQGHSTFKQQAQGGAVSIATEVWNLMVRSSIVNVGIPEDEPAFRKAGFRSPLYDGRTNEIPD